MENQIKAGVVIACLFMFCAVPVAGPLLGDAGDEVVRRALDLTTEAKIGNVKTRTDARYVAAASASAPLKTASQCCLGCDASWSYSEDRCMTVSQSENECYLNCTTNPKAKK
ncbi:MAG: hypothetical protein VX589_20400 [Myxococcota bacterium]|nr:hypothetical protein [Myxococcota bacterium]